MKTKQSLRMLGIMFLSAIVAVSCEQREEIPENELVLLEELALNEVEMDNVLQEALEEIDEFTFLADYSAAEARSDEEGTSGSRTVNTTVSGDGTVHIEIEYENFVNPRSRYQREKNGRILVEVTGRPLGPREFFRKVIFDNFKVGKYVIEGTKTIERDPDIPQRYHVKLVNGKVSFDDGTILLIREFERTITWRYGYDTPYFIWDDVYTIEGQGRGMTRDGRHFTNEIIEPLIVRRDCRYIVSGIMKIKLGEREVTIDYGENDKCSDQFRMNSNWRSRMMRFRTGG